MRKNVLVVAQQVELRARIARVLQSAGYGAELAENPKRALELARRKDIQAAIVVQSRDLACLGQELRDKIPTTILLGHRTDDIVRPGHSLQETDAFPEDALDERKLLDLLSQAAALPGSKGDETVPAPVKNRGLQSRPGRPYLRRWQRQGSAADPRRDRAADRLRGQSSPGAVARPAP